MYIQSLKDSYKLIETLNLSKTIFWIGAGISIDKPSCLPSGASLTDFYVQKCIGEVFYKYIMEKWDRTNTIVSKTNSIINKFLFKDDLLKDYEVELPRLEFVIDCIDSVDTELKFMRMIDGFKNFDKVEINLNHLILGKILKNYHSTMITANFDYCIEKSLYSNLIFTSKLNVPVVQVGDDNVYHYHGTVHDIENLGATIKQIKRKLPIDFTNRLKAQLLEGYNIIFVGFSCSDFFDVTPLFESFKPNSYKGIAIYFNHKTNESDITDINNKQIEKVDKFLTGFKNRYMINGITTEFLQFLLKEENSISIDETRINYWRDSFDKITVTPEAYICYLIKLFNQIGINIPKIFNRMDINISKLFLDKKYDSSIELIKFIIKNISIKNITQHIEASNLSTNKNHSILADVITLCERNRFNSLNVQKIKHQFRKAKQTNNSKNEKRYKNINELWKDIIDWDGSTDKFCSSWIFSIYKFTWNNIMLYYLHICRHNVKKHLNMLSVCINKLLLLDFNDFPYMSYFIDLNHYKWIIDVVLSGITPNANEINRLLEIMTEICNMDYIAKHYRWLVYVYIIKYMKNGDKTYIRTASLINRQINKLVEVIDDKRENNKDIFTKFLLQVIRNLSTS